MYLTLHYIFEISIDQLLNCPSISLCSYLAYASYLYVNLWIWFMWIWTLYVINEGNAIVTCDNASVRNMPNCCIILIMMPDMLIFMFRSHLWSHLLSLVMAVWRWCRANFRLSTTTLCMCSAMAVIYKHSNGAQCRIAYHSRCNQMLSDVLVSKMRFSLQVGQVFWLILMP